ncbi:MAG: SDR family NAD(P)-dependent oxidoreductase, partial [Notoacmeibacter sp.]
MNSDHKPVALITGGAKRIGAAIAEDLAANGFAVAIHANRARAEALEMASGINTSGGKAAAVFGDLTDSANVPAIIDEAEAALGPVQILVNSASVFQPDTAQAPNLLQFEEHFSMHLKAPSLLSARL